MTPVEKLATELLQSLIYEPEEWEEDDTQISHIAVRKITREDIIVYHVSGHIIMHIPIASNIMLTDKTLADKIKKEMYKIREDTNNRKLDPNYRRAK